MKSGYKVYIKDESHFEYVENVLSNLGWCKWDDCYEGVKVVTLRHSSGLVYYAYKDVNLSIDDLLTIDIDDLAWLIEN